MKRHNFTRKALFLSPNFGEGIAKTTELIRQATTFVIIRPSNDGSLQKTVEEQISALGDKLCPITDHHGGNLLFDLWYPEGFDYACKSD